ncbi:hypothetical protein NLK61_24860 [Pseudomonas fuscovaginae UPB0736]|uniref:hypothetical protein n=1 Tax=Pseudomonas asplenii TaxID=53407 RepID=UPI000287DC5B|nr:hypothetical protein [Pseudomonas fuscovaginae]UUQ64409.1 hypothetical protein NLK61_24860 [Pseudomonas fuscovaginae UPB0736]
MGLKANDIGTGATLFFTALLVCGIARADTIPVADCGDVAAPTPEDYMEVNGERVNLAATGGDKVCGQTIFFDKKRLRLSENNLQFVLKYEGEMKDGIPDGKGTLYFLQHERVVGFFEGGLPHGQYVRYDNGSIALESGMYDHGKRTGIITSYYPSTFVSGIRGQLPYLNDEISDGPLMYNEVSYSTGLIKRAFIGEIKDGVKSGGWKDVVSVRVQEHYPILLDSQLFGEGKLNSEQLSILDSIDAGLRSGKITVSDVSGYYVDPKADVSPAALEKLLGPKIKPYISKLNELLKLYQKPYYQTRVTTGTQGYVVLNDNQVLYASFDPEKNQFFGNAISTFMSGESYEGSLNSRGANFEGEVIYRNGADGSKLVGQFSPGQGRIDGKANYTFYDPTINKTVTKPVIVVNGAWEYKTKAQEDYENTKRGISEAWKGIFHNGNVFKKLEDSFHLLRDSALYPFVWVAVKYDLEKVGASWSDNKGAGIIVAKNGIGDFNITIGDVREIAVLVTSKGDEKAALKVNFKAGMYIEQGDQFSYGVESNLKNKKDRSGELFKKATVTPVIAKKGSYFTTMEGVAPIDAYDQFFNQQLMNGYDWTPSQKDELASVIFDDFNNDKIADEMAKQLKVELLGTYFENFYKVGPVQAQILAECMNWSINRMKNGLKPEYKFQLYALMELSKYAYDQTVWAKLTNPARREEVTDRQRVIVLEAMKALEEFESFLKENNQDRNLYRVQQVPFKY